MWQVWGTSIWDQVLRDLHLVYKESHHSSCLEVMLSSLRVREWRRRKTKRDKTSLACKRYKILRVTKSILRVKLKQPELIHFSNTYCNIEPQSTSADDSTFP